MEAASVPTGGPQDAGTDAGGQQEQAEQSQPQGVPPEILERLDEVKGFREDMAPLLEALQAPPEGEEEQDPGFEQYYDDETGEFDPQAFDQTVEQRARAIAAEETGPLAQQLQQLQEYLQQEELEALGDDYPQLRDPEYMKEFGPALQQETQALGQEVAQSLGMPPQAAQAIADALGRNANFIESQHLARLAGQQAQQGAPAGDQGVHLEGGSGNPGTPQRDETLERFDRMVAQGSQGLYGKTVDQL